MMSTTYTPPGMPSLMPYLSVKNAQGLQAFMAEVFGAETLDEYRDDAGHIVHGAARIGTSVVEYSEAKEPWPATPAGLHVYVPDVDATYAKALSAGAVSLDAPSDKHYGERGGSVRDPFGNLWHLATFRPQ